MKHFISSETIKDELTNVENVGDFELREDLFARRKKALVSAAERGDANIVKELLAKEEDHAVCEEALACASGRGYVEVVKMLIAKEGVKANFIGYGGMPPLVSATARGYFEVVQLLLGVKGIDVNARDYGGNCALICAVSRGDSKIANLLLSREDVDINVRDNFGGVALIRAMRQSKISADIILLLVRKSLLAVNAVDLMSKIIPAASKKNMKALVYSGEILKLFNNKSLSQESAIKVLGDMLGWADSRCGSYSFLNGTRAMLQLIFSCSNIEKTLHRVKFLAASVCGVDISVADMNLACGSLEKFRRVRYLMRAAILAKLAHGHNMYLSLHSFIFNKNNFGIDLDVKTHVLSFLSSENVAFFASGAGSEEPHKNAGESGKELAASLSSL